MSGRDPDPEIWLGDLVRCLVRLQPQDAATARAVVAALGLGFEEPEPVESAAEEAPRQPSVPESAPSTERPAEDTAAPAPDLGAVPLLPTATDEAATMEPLPWATVEPLRRGPPETARPAPPREPLLDPRWTRQLVAYALATPVYDGPVDGVALVDRIARGKPVVRIPRRPRPSLRVGAQLLVDIGEAMEPYAADRWDVQAELERVVGATCLQTLQFRDAPVRGAGAGPVWTWPERYEPPEPGVPVLVLTDLGIGGIRASSAPSQEREWLELAGILRRRGSRLIVLVPYPATRWPVRLARELTVVEWDRTTTVRQMHTLVRPPQRAE